MLAASRSPPCSSAGGVASASTVANRYPPGSCSASDGCTSRRDRAQEVVTLNLRERIFARPEGWLGRIGGWIMAHTNRSTTAWAIQMLDIDPSDRVLEVGFGPGVGIELAAEHAHEGLVAGVDPSPAMLETACERNRDAIEAGRVELVRGHATRLPWGAGTFDKALAVNTLPLWQDIDAGLVEIRRVLREDASIAIAFTPRFADSAEGVPDRLTRAGFQRARRISGEAGVCVLANAMPTGDEAKR